MTENDVRLRGCLLDLPHHLRVLNEGLDVVTELLFRNRGIALLNHVSRASSFIQVDGVPPKDVENLIVCLLRS